MLDFEKKERDFGPAKQRDKGEQAACWWAQWEEKLYRLGRSWSDGTGGGGMLLWKRTPSLPRVNGDAGWRRGERERQLRDYDSTRETSLSLSVCVRRGREGI